MSNKESAVIVHDIHKQFVLPQHKSHSLKQVFVSMFHRNKPAKQKALDGVSFTVKRGEFFGIIGRNGSGKSTLLKLLAGVYTPTSGSIELRGELTPFIELGVGFNPELSGRDNIYLNGALLGFTRKQMHEMYDDIVEFAELKPFMDQKLKNYSSGMQVRLAFSIAIKAKNEILIFDEVLAVGDENFQKKCIETFEELKRSGSTIIFVSHAMGQVRQFCDRVAVMSKGRVAFIGDTDTAIDEYHNLNDEDRCLEVTKTKTKTEQRFGNGKAHVEKFEVVDEYGNTTNTLATGKQFSVRVKIKYLDHISNLSLGVMFRKNPKENLYGINNYYEKINFTPRNPGEIIEVIYSDIMPLTPDKYYLTIAVVDAKSSIEYDDLDILNNITQVKVSSPNEMWGAVRNTATLKEVQ